MRSEFENDRNKLSLKAQQILEGKTTLDCSVKPLVILSNYQPLHAMITLYLGLKGVLHKTYDSKPLSMLAYTASQKYECHIVAKSLNTLLYRS